MRVSELLGAPVVDPDGRAVGHVRDLRLRQGEEPGDWEVVGCITGRGVVAERLGYAYGTATGPWLVSRLMRRIGRGMRYIAWSDATWDAGARTLTLQRPASELQHPDDVEVA